MTCLARVYGSQTICAACGLNWDTNDAEPPSCGKVDRRSKIARAVLREDVKPKTVKGLPDKLPDHLARLMEKAYRANGIHAAYRVLIDEVGI